MTEGEADELLLDRWEQEAASPRQIALLRIQWLNQRNCGIAATLVPFLTRAVSTLIRNTTFTTSAASLRNNAHANEACKELRRILKLHLYLAQQDAVLAEELGRQGSHAQLIKVLQMHFNDSSDGEQDCLFELQDIAGEIAAASRPHFPLVPHPLSVADVKARLPLVFEMGASSSKAFSDCEIRITVLIHQVTSRQSAQVDVGFGTDDRTIPNNFFLLTCSNRSSASHFSPR